MIEEVGSLEKARGFDCWYQCEETGEVKEVVP